VAFLKFLSECTGVRGHILVANVSGYSVGCAQVLLVYLTAICSNTFVTRILLKL
jgi:hypothetical protein